MNSWMRAIRGLGGLWAAVGIGSLLAAAGPASKGSAEHSLLEHVSTGPTGGNGAVEVDFMGASVDGGRVFFEAEERLVSADTDMHFDVYERSGGRATLVSIGPNGGNGAVHAGFVGASADGARVFFVTTESLVAADTDTTSDVYERSGGQTTLISTGPAGGNGDLSAFFERTSADGTRVFFQTRESLVTADNDGAAFDVYERSGGQTTLVTTGPTGSNADALSRGASADGSRVFFHTHERLVSADTDDSRDVYERSGGQTTLISTGPAGGNGAFDANFALAPGDGSRVFFETAEPLVSADTDMQTDVYVRSGGQTTLVSTIGNSPLGAAFFADVSADGTRVFFRTFEVVGPGPVLQSDIWERSGGQTTLVTTGPTGGNGAFEAVFGDASADGGGCSSGRTSGW